MFQQVRAAVALAIMLAAAAGDNSTDEDDMSVQLVADLDEYSIHVASLVQLTATEALTEDRMELTISCGGMQKSTDEMKFHKCSQSEWRDVLDIRCSSGQDVVIRLKERDLHYHDIGELRLPKLRTWSFPVGRPVEVSIPLEVTMGPGDDLLKLSKVCLSDVFVTVAGAGTAKVVSTYAARKIKLSQKALRRLRGVGGELADEILGALAEMTLGWLLDALDYVDKCWGATLPDASYSLTLEFTADAPYPAEPTPIKEGSQEFLEKAECIAGQESFAGLRVWQWALIGAGVIVLCLCCCCLMCKK